MHFKITTYNACGKRVYRTPLSDLDVVLEFG
jgi:hypothetical protein